MGEIYTSVEEVIPEVGERFGLDIHVVNCA